MRRTLMQIYVKGSVEAVELYRKTFDAPIMAEYKNGDGTYAHCEIDIYGQILAVSEFGPDVDSARTVGNNMQFCLHFERDEKDIVTKAYNILIENAKKIYEPLGPCPFSPHMASFVDKFGTFWCIFTE